MVAMPEIKTLDRLSQRILKELSLNARVSDAEIGRRVGLSSPAVAERIHKMEEQGIIKGYSSVIDFEKVGFPIRALLSFKCLALKHDDMLSMIKEIKEVKEWYTITGTPCMVLKIIAPSGKELEAVIVHLGKFGETSTSLILSEGTSPKFCDHVFR
jgi:Lrp/AsnC family leucine-responsive transcriptional regulator